MTRLEEIEARVQAATEGPWDPTDDFVQKVEPPWSISEDAIAHDVMRDDDRLFIAHAREDVPWLLAEVAYLRGELRDTIHEYWCGTGVCECGPLSERHHDWTETR